MHTLLSEKITLAETKSRKGQMVRGGLSWIVVVLCMLAGVLAAQQKSAEEQSPRQAILEMFSGGEDALKKHLTLEVQEKISELLKGSAPGGTNPMQAINAAKAAGGRNFESFDAGTILFSLNNSQQHERLEIHIDGDDLHGEEDDMQLSLHAFRSGVEQELPLGLRLLLTWKQQQGVWRLNAFTLNARVPVGDPRILDKSWWTPPVIGALSGSAAAAVSPEVTNGRPKMTPARSVRLIGLAENLYAKKHPEVGFTCFLSELVDVGKGLDDGEPYKFMDPEFAGGVYNGYRFSLSGCAGKPVKAFQVTAEPVNGPGKAYCSDYSHDLRASEDGLGSTCLASGKIVRQ